MSTESPSGFPDVSPSRREVLDVAAKVAVFVVGVAYAVGLVIVNIDLARHGVTNVSLTRPEYVLVGSLWLAVTMIGVASAVFLRQLVGKLWRTGQRAAALLMSALGAFVLVIALTGLGEIVSGGALLRGEVSGWFAVGGVVHWGGVLGIWLMATDVSGGRDWRTVAILGVKSESCWII